MNWRHRLGRRRSFGLSIALGLLFIAAFGSTASFAVVDLTPKACVSLRGQAGVDCVTAYLTSTLNKRKGWQFIAALPVDTEAHGGGWANNSELAVPSDLWIAEAGVPSLFLDCRGGAARGFVHWDLTLPDTGLAGYVIGISTDDGPYRFRAWKTNEGGFQSTYAPSPAWPFFEELQGKGKADFVIQLPGRPEVRARFRLGGIDKILADLAARCPA